MAKNKVEKLDEGQENMKKDVVAVQMPPVVYSVTDKALAELREKYNDVPDASTPEGMELCKEALRELVPLRTGVEKARVELKKDALEYGRKVDAEAKRITAEIVSIEKPIADAKTAEQERAEREKQEEIAREQNRIDAIEQRIGNIRSFARDLNLPADALQGKLDALDEFNLTEELFEEYYQQALDAMIATKGMIKEALVERVKFDEQKAEQEAEAERQAERQRELDAQQAELDKQAEEVRLAQEAEQRRLDEQREAQEREQREHEERLAQEQRDKEERERQEQAERDRQAEEERQEQERLENEKKERKRLAKLKPQVELLISYVKSVDNAVHILEAPEIEDESLRMMCDDFRTAMGTVINAMYESLE